MGIKILNEKSLKSSLKMEDVIEISEKVYLQKSEDKSVIWDTIFYDFETGKADMDIKSGYLKSEKIFGHKTVTWFTNNVIKNLPTLTGIICVFDANTGFLIGVTEAAYITGMRTGAAGAIGAKYLANPEAKNVLIIGAGNQLKFQVAGILTVFPQLEKVNVYNRNVEKAKIAIENLPNELSEMGVKNFYATIELVSDLENSMRNSSVIITITSSREPIIKKEWLSPGTHLSCMGADMKGKQEIEAEIFKNAQIYTDDLHHSSQFGEMENALKQGIISIDEVTGEIGDLINQNIVGRKSSETITIFDATGIALMDIATAKVAIDNTPNNKYNTFKF